LHVSMIGAAAGKPVAELLCGRRYVLDHGDVALEWIASATCELVPKHDHPTNGDESDRSKPSRRTRQRRTWFCRPTGVGYGPVVGVTLPAVFHTSVAPECPARIIVAMANPATGTAMA
jgi:hypothetical protein